MAASLVGTTTTHYALAYSCVRKCFHANGRFWVFYSDGYNMIYKTSTDGATWSSSIIIGACGRGYGFSVWFDGTYLHYVLCYPTDAPTYRRGEPMADGSIVWSAPESIFWSQSSHTSHIPSISVDSEGYPFIAFLRRIVATEEYYFVVTKSSKNDGTWETSPGFPYQLQAVCNETWQDASVIPLTNGKMYVAYNYDNSTMKGRLWDGSSWGDEETASVSSVNTASCFSVAREGDDVHLVFSGGVNQDIIYVKRTYGIGWGSETVVHALPLSADLAIVKTAPVLSIDGDGTLYCFWIDYPIANHIFYKKCVAGVWDITPTDLGDTGAGGLIYFGTTCYCGAYDGYVGLLYYKYNSVQDIKHDFLSGLTPYTPVTEYPTPTIGSTVGTTTTKYGMWMPFQRKLFYAKGKFWVFYATDMDTIVYRTSTDGQTWSSETVVSTTVDFGASSFTIWFDGTYVHYASDHNDKSLYYRRGTPNDNGTITWGTDELLIAQNSEAVGSVCVDTNGCPWVVYDTYVGSGVVLPSVIKSSTNDGNWTDPETFPYLFGNKVNYPIVLPLANGEMYLISSRHHSITGGDISGRFWNGSVWEEAEIALADKYNNGQVFSAVVYGNDIHLVSQNTNNEIVYVKRTYGDDSPWSSPIVLQSSTGGYTYPVLSIDQVGDLYCFWVGFPTANHIYYKKCTNGVWDASATDLGMDYLTGNFHASSYYAYGGYIGFAYETGAQSPYNIRHTFIETPLSPPSDLCIWLADHGAPLDITVTDVFAVINSYLFETPPSGYTFVPTLQNVFGVIDYHFGFDGDAMTGCDFFP